MILNLNLLMEEAHQIVNETMKKSKLNSISHSIMKGLEELGIQ